MALGTVPASQSKPFSSRHGPDPVGLGDVAFVVRSAGERTLEAACFVLRSQIEALGGGSPVTVIHERPFSNAVRRTLSIGAESGRAWTIGMDADVLLTSDGVGKLLNMCRSAKPDSFTVTGLMLCRFYGGFVFRGIHCYRSELLDQAVGLVGMRSPGGPDPELKPESAVVHAMAARGHGYEGHPVVLAAHDYEQSYKHIYLKMRLRGRREVEAGEDGDAPGLVQFCQSKLACASGPGDSDFLVALWGALDGIADARGAAHARAMHYDWFAEYPELARRMAEHGLTEKPVLAAREGLGLAEQVIAAHDLETDTRTPRWIREMLKGARLS